jgi:hypothetical protein
MTTQGKNLKFWDQPVPVEVEMEPAQASLLEQPAPVQYNSPQVILSDAEAELVANETLKALDSRGYCLWRCTLLRGDFMMLVRDDLSENSYTGFPHYTLEEVEKLEEIQVSTLRLIHQIKKQSGGAIIISVEPKKQSNGKGGANEDRKD